MLSKFCQCFETLVTLYADVLFSNISAQDTVKQIKKKKKNPSMKSRDITTKNDIYKLGFVICKYFLPLLFKTIKCICINNALNDGHVILVRTFRSGFSFVLNCQ